MLLKKYFVDNQEGVSPSDLEQIKSAVMGSLDFQTQQLPLLKRKGDLISKIYMLLN